MTELTIIEKNAFEKLPEGLKPYAQARIEKPVKSIGDIELKGKCFEIIGVSFAEQGQMSVEPAILAFQRDTLFTELRTNSKFKELTLSEVRSAFKTGIRGDSGPFFGMCAKTYHQFLKYYYEKPERIECMKQFLALIEEPKKAEKPLHLKIQETKESIIRAFEEYKETKKLPFTAFAYYDFLKDGGLINWTKEQKNEMKAQAEREYEGTLRERKSQGLIKADKIAELMLNLGTNATFLNICKRIALKKYFDFCITTNYDIVKELKG